MLEHVAWWMMYFAGDLRTAIVPRPASWEAFVDVVERAPRTLALCQDPLALCTTLRQTLARKRAFVPESGVTVDALARPYTPARAGS
jgi:hypothetical protein